MATVQDTLITSERLENFLDTYTFHSNSIDFRIHSSKSLEKFKNVQSYQLNQIANGKFYFTKDRKEILLLKYDMWYRWLLEVENYLIEMSSKNQRKILDENCIHNIIELSDKTCNVYKQTMLNDKTEYFDQQFVEMWLAGHESAYELLKLKINSLIGYKFDISFDIMVDNLIELMQFTLVELHELDNLFKYCNEEENEKIPFLAFTNLDRVCNKLTDKYLIINRLKVYMKHFEIKEIYLKNYSDRQFDMRIFDLIESFGVKIDYKSNF